MPNHIQNKLFVSASNKETLNYFLDSIKGTNNFDDAEQVIDFNTIIPMPSVLNDTESSTTTHESIYYYLMMNDKLNLVDKILPFPSLYSADRVLKNKTEEKLKEMYELGEKYFVEIFNKCSAIDWYEWRCKNWGTKWNAYDSYYDMLSETQVLIYFQTAWSGVPKLIELLVQKFPTLQFEYKYSDEDMGYNCGVGNGINGHFEFEYYGIFSDETMEIYKECWGIDDDTLLKDENGKWIFVDE